MFQLLRKKRCTALARIGVFFVVVSFSSTFLYPLPKVQAQSVLELPMPGAMVTLTASFSPAIIKGITIHPEDPFLFDFIVHPGDDNLEGEDLKKESMKLIKYFMAALTVPEDEMWVNLSPYEKNRIIPDGFGDTEMGRDLLAQDYLLKQLTASLMYPEKELGSNFWNRVYERAEKEYGTTEIPMNTFNKVWIVPERAVIYQNDVNVFVVESHLKVMLEEDYLALEENVGSTKHGLGSMKKEGLSQISKVSSEVIREIIIPEIEREVNEGKTFANLRQISNSVILATWYKQNIRQGLLKQIYVNKNRTDGIDTKDKEINQQIYDQYVRAFKKGVYNFIKEDYNETTQEVIPRKYFSGGAKEDWRGKIHLGGKSSLRQDLIGTSKLIIKLSSSPVDKDISSDGLKKIKQQAYGPNGLGGLIDLEKSYNESRIFMSFVSGFSGAILGAISSLVATQDSYLSIGGALVGFGVFVASYWSLFPESKYVGIEEGIRELERAASEEELQAVRGLFIDSMKKSDLVTLHRLGLTGIEIVDELLELGSYNGDKYTRKGKLREEDYSDLLDVSKFNLVVDFTEVNGLGEGTPIALVVKGINTPKVIARRKAKWIAEKKLDALIQPVRDVSADSFVSIFSLQNDMNIDSSIWSKFGREPRDISMREDVTAIAFTDEIVFVNSLTGKQIGQPLRDPKFRGLHTIEYHPNIDNRLLVSSGGVDRFLEIDFDLENSTHQIIYEWLAWEHGYSTNIFNMEIVEKGSSLDRFEGYEILTQDQIVEMIANGDSSLKEKDRLRVVEVDSTKVEHPLGLGQLFKAADPNWVGYNKDGTKFLATFFHKGQAVEIDRNTGDVNIVLEGLARPHGFIKFEDGYLISDTQHGNVIEFDESLQLVASYKFSDLPTRDEIEENYVSDWIQYSQPLGGGLIATVDSRRATIFIWDPVSKFYSSYPYDPTWVVQSVLPIKSDGLFSKVITTHGTAMNLADSISSSPMDLETVGNTKGGIDLNAGIYDIEIRGAKEGFDFKFNNQSTINSNINGLIPVIINVTSVTNIPFLLGENNQGGEVFESLSLN